MDVHAHGCTQACRHARRCEHTRVCVGGYYFHAGNSQSCFPADLVGSCSSLPGEGCGSNRSFAQVLVSMGSGEWRISEVPLLFPLLNFRMF